MPVYSSMNRNACPSIRNIESRLSLIFVLSVSRYRNRIGRPSTILTADDHFPATKEKRYVLILFDGRKRQRQLSPKAMESSTGALAMTAHPAGATSVNSKTALRSG